MSEKIYPVGLSFNTNRYSRSDLIKQSTKKAKNEINLTDVPKKIDKVSGMSAKVKLHNILKTFKIV